LIGNIGGAIGYAEAGVLLLDSSVKFYCHILHCFDAIDRGVATGVYGYTPKSVQANFLWVRNDVRTAIEHEY